MEFQFSLNNLLGNEISKIDNNLTPFRRNGSSYRTQLCTVIDEMGVASARAQGLGGPITGASRLSHSDHHLYIMKDEAGSNGNGAAVGILKMGRKKLFIYDNHGRQHEMEPLCVLDFYVHESKQRMGCGKKMFEYMLQEEQVRPGHLAVDRPSPKFLSFLARHYNLKVPITQVNNFVVFEGFFRERPAEPSANRRRGKPPIIPYRQNSHIPLYGADRWQQQPIEPSPSGGLRSAPPATSNLNREAAGSSGNELVWDRRHGSPSLLTWGDPPREGPARPTEPGGGAPLQNKPGIGAARPTEPGSGSPKPTEPGSGAPGLTEPGKEALRNIHPRETNMGGSEQAAVGSRNSSSSSGPDSPSHRGMGAHGSMYSRHQEGAPGSGETRRSNTPPMLGRDGPSNDYLAMRNNIHSAANGYQDRRGHLVVENRTSPTKETVQRNGRRDSSNTPQVKLDSGWNILGVPNSPKHSAGGRYQQTRLW